MRRTDERAADAPPGTSSGVAPAAAPRTSSGGAFPAAAAGYNIYGLPGWTRQADVLRPLAPILSARDDTFTIRAYGDARDATGNTVKARAVCEATIRRSSGHVHDRASPEVRTPGPIGHHDAAR